MTQVMANPCQREREREKDPTLILCLAALLRQIKAALSQREISTPGALTCSPSDHMGTPPAAADKKAPRRGREREG